MPVARVILSQWRRSSFTFLPIVQLAYKPCKGCPDRRPPLKRAPPLKGPSKRDNTPRQPNLKTWPAEFCVGAGHNMLLSRGSKGRSYVVSKTVTPQLSLAFNSQVPSTPDTGCITRRFVGNTLSYTKINMLNETIIRKNSSTYSLQGNPLTQKILREKSLPSQFLG